MPTLPEMEGNHKGLPLQISSQIQQCPLNVPMKFSFSIRILFTLAYCLLPLLFIGCLCSTSAVLASTLTERIAAFPEWNDKPTVQSVEGDLIYPDWMVGTWKLTSTLKEMVAPLAPEVTTPGFEGNRDFLNIPITCPVRFVPNTILERNKAVVPFLSLPTKSLTTASVVSDRAFNGLSLAKAYLGDRVFRVWVDSRDPNRMTTKFRDNRKLFSFAIGRTVEQPDPDRFIASELFQQFFQAPEKPYKNQVETTTAYTHQPDGSVTADQFTAVYLNPPHPKAFVAGDRPVALYRYTLGFTK
ncbi:DUF6816 family protein [Leptolyngbyaceae cyanobacterium UHCC 1019]